ncbi:ATP synthase F1 subunit gamma [Candidatus Nomurabacteria bacterium]|nr:ATP synthase F1 subunit gamma [Candidatus Nomurabacteria bacterium]
MASLKQIKGNIAAMKKSQAVTRAMEAVAAAKMRKSQQRALAGRAYARAAATVLARVSGTRDVHLHPLAMTNTAAPRGLYIVITSDKGLAGALNSAVLKGAVSDMAREGLSPKDVSVIAIGKKAHDYFASRGFTIMHHVSNTDMLSSEDTRTIIARAQERYMGGEYRFVKVAYQNFVSTFEQRPTLRGVFPLAIEELTKVVADIVPAKGADAESESVAPTTYTIEPSAEEVIGAIMPRLASVILYHALLESQASEHSARMVAMKSASDKAGEKQHELTLKFNKARQAAITREVSEIIGGMEAVAH